MDRTLKQTFFAALMLLLSPLSTICQAESLTRHFVVEHKQNTQSFSVKRSLISLPDNRKHLPDTNVYAVFLPPDDKPHKLGVYGLPMTFIESISWPLLYASNVLVAYEWALNTRNPALRGKTYSWIPEEVFVAVGWLLKSYWTPDSLLFNPMDQLSRDDPFTITTMTLPGQNKQQSNQQNPPSESSGRQALGATSHVTGSIKRLLSSLCNKDKEDPEQDQHTLGLECYVDSCHGVCKLRQASNSSEEEKLSSTESSTGQKAKKNRLQEVDEYSESLANAVPDIEIDESNTTADDIVSEIIEHMNTLITILIENDAHYKVESPTPDIQVFRNAIELLEHLDPSDISQGPEVTDSNCNYSIHDGYSDTWYLVYYRGKVLFTVTQTGSEDRFEGHWTSGESARIKTEDLFNELYYAPDAPGYQFAKSEFEKCRKE